MPKYRRTMTDTKARRRPAESSIDVSEMRIHVACAGKSSAKALGELERGLNDAAASGRDPLVVVEDDALQRSQIAIALVRSGHRVVEALVGNEALSRLHGKRYDLLLTDLLMDQGTGFDVLEWVQKNAPGLPVLICSSYAKAENLKTFLTTQFYRIIRKPFRTDNLIDQVRELLASATRERI